MENDTEDKPTTMEIAQLAALLYDKNFEAIMYAGDITPASRSVEIACKLWEESNRAVIEKKYINREPTETEALKNRLAPYSYGLQIENHYMGEISDEWLLKSHVNYRELISEIVGIKHFRSQKTWFDKFLEYITEELEGNAKDSIMNDLGFLYMGEGDPYREPSEEETEQFLESLKNCIGSQSPIEESNKLTPHLITESLENYGTEHHHSILVEYRKWRIKSTLPEDADHQTLEEAINQSRQNAQKKE